MPAKPVRSAVAPPAAPAPPLDLFIVTAPGLEALTLAEVRALGLDAEVGEPGGLVLRGDRAALEQLHLQLRTATRVLVRVAGFTATSFAELERRARLVDWTRGVIPGARVRLRVTCRKSRLYHSDAVAERVARAIGEQVRGVEVSSTAGGDTRADAGADEQLIVVRFVRDRATVSLDASGAALHARGYREATARAPLRETLAAALLLAAEWAPEAPLVDPMCGSGTIAIEAALRARGIPPGAHRAFAFERWPGHDAAAWRARRAAALAEARPRAPAPIVASDRDAGAVAAARANAERAGVADDVTVLRRGVSEFEPPEASDPGWVVSNPPYGVRVGEREPLRALYARLGAVLRERAPGWHVALLSADEALERATALPLGPVLRTANGGIPVRVVAGRVKTG